MELTDPKSMYQKANMQATYTLDDISLSGPRCCEGGPVITEIAGAGNGTGP